jgi:hypothetical protein
LNDKGLLVALASGASDASCAARIVDQYRKIRGLTGADTLTLLSQFTDFALRLNSVPAWKPDQQEPGSYRFSDKRNGERISMLLEWWRLSDLQVFLEAAIQTARAPIGGFSAWSDANFLPDILVELLTASQDEREQTVVLQALLENSLHSMLGSGLQPDDLDRLLRSIDENATVLHPLFGDGIEVAVRGMIEHVGDNLDQVESESTLTDYIGTVEKLAARVEYDLEAVASAKSAIESRIDAIRGQAAEEEELSVTGDRDLPFDLFDDVDLENLFAPLLAGE